MMWFIVSTGGSAMHSEIDPRELFDFKSFFDKHLDEIKKSTFIDNELRESDLHNCFCVANRLDLQGLGPKESMVESIKYFTENPNSKLKIDEIVMRLKSNYKLRTP